MNNENSNTNFWISYADLMAGLLFVFILLIGAIIVKYSLLENESKVLEKILMSEKTKLEKTKKELEAKEFKISNTIVELADVKLALKDTSAKLKYNDQILKDTIIKNKELEIQLIEQQTKFNVQKSQLVNKNNKISEYLAVQKDYESQVSQQKTENLSLIEKLEITNSTLVQKEDALNELLKNIQVASTPGLDFGQNKSNVYLRFAYTRDIEHLKEGVERLKAYLKNKKLT